MKQSGHLNPSEKTGTGCPVTSKYGRRAPNKKEVWVDNNNNHNPSKYTCSNQKYRAIQYPMGGGVI